MSETIQPGLHPDPDSLNAFIEGVLPEHERLQCLTHLALCPSCREIVYLAQEPLESEPLPVVPVIEKVSFWKRWFAPAYALSAAATVGVLLLSFTLYQHYKFALEVSETIATVTPLEAPPPPEPVQQPLQAMEKTTPRARIAAAPRQEKRSEKKDMIQQPVAEPVAAPFAPLAVAAPVSTPVAAASPTVAVPRPLAAFDASNIDVLPTGIAGTITDPAGSAIAGAAVKLRPLTGPASRNLSSDPKGQFNLAGLEPGRYELQVMAPGFKTMMKQVDIQPNQMARADSTLSVGSVAETISVTAEAARVEISSGAAAGGRGGGGGGRSGVQPLPTRPSVTFASEVKVPVVADATVAAAKATAASQAPVLILPNKLPAKLTAVSGKLTLATDSAGTLFLSENAGKKWKTIKSVWHGKVVALVASDPSFQLTTDSGAIWLSRDGNHWYVAPASK